MAPTSVNHTQIWLQTQIFSPTFSQFWQQATWTNSSPQLHISGCTWGLSGHKQRPGCSMGQVRDRADLQQQNKVAPNINQSIKTPDKNSRFIYDIIVVFSYHTDDPWYHILVSSEASAARTRHNNYNMDCRCQMTCRGRRDRRRPSCLLSGA